MNVIIVRLVRAALALFAATAAVAQPTGLNVTLSGKPLNGSDATHPYAAFSASLGANLVLRVAAGSASPLSYQWSFNHAALPGQTGATLTILSAQLTNAGDYTVVVSNATGAATTNVTLSIDSAFTKITTGNIVTASTQGVAGSTWADYDKDGFLDAFIFPGADDEFRAPQLYHNNGDGTFTQVTTLQPSVSVNGSCACWGDYDNDGYPDLYVSSTEQKVLYHNNGNGTFTRTQAAGRIVTDVANTFDVTAADFNNDGFLDFFAGTEDTAAKSHCYLYSNNGNGTFGAVTNGPLVTDLASSFGGSWADYDNDGHIDIFVGGGRTPGSGILAPNRLYHNNGDGTFTRVTNAGPIVTDLGFGGTCVWGDYDNDGYFDALAMNAGGLTNFLYHNNRDGTFTRITNDVVAQDKTPNIADDGADGAAWGDYDNDGFLDLFISNNGNASPVTVNFLYHNNGDGTFTRVMTGSVANEYSDTGGCVWVDYDNDGFLDLFVTGNHGQGNYLYHNNGNTNGWLTVRLRGTVSNASAVGAKVRVKAHYRGADRWQLRQIFSGSGWAGHDELQANFGLGDATNVDTLRIEWPSGIVQEFHDVAPKQILNITEPPRLSATVTNGAPSFALKGGRNLSYEIDSSLDLKSWNVVSQFTITNSSGVTNIIDPNPPVGAQLFYRAVMR